MEPSEFYIFEEVFDHKTVFTKIQPQGYAKSPDNILRKVNLNLKSKQESRRNPIHTAHITESTQGGKASLKSVILHGLKQSILEDEKRNIRFKN